MNDVALVSVVARYSIVGMNPTVVPAFGIHAIYAKNLQLPRFNLAGQLMNHAVVFKFEKAALRSRKHQDRMAPVSVGQ